MERLVEKYGNIEYTRKNLSHISYKNYPSLIIFPYIIKNFYSRKIKTVFGQKWNWFDGIEDGSKLKKVNFMNHGKPLLELMSKYKDILENKKIIIFVTDNYGLFVNRVREDLEIEFSKSQEKYLNNIVFSSLDGNDIEKYYYVIDSHMNSLGHFEMGNKILSIIEKSK